MADKPYQIRAAFDTTDGKSSLTRPVDNKDFYNSQEFNEMPEHVQKAIQKTVEDLHKKHDFALGTEIMIQEKNPPQGVTSNIVFDKQPKIYIGTPKLSGGKSDIEVYAVVDGVSGNVTNFDREQPVLGLSNNTRVHQEPGVEDHSINKSPSNEEVTRFVNDVRELQSQAKKSLPTDGPAATLNPEDLGSPLRASAKKIKSGPATLNPENLHPPGWTPPTKKAPDTPVR